MIAVEDSLVKGAAGQTVQNTNPIFDFAETGAIDRLAVVP